MNVVGIMCWCYGEVFMDMVVVVVLCWRPDWCLGVVVSFLWT